MCLKMYKDMYFFWHTLNNKIWENFGNCVSSIDFGKFLRKSANFGYWKIEWKNPW